MNTWRNHAAPYPFLFGNDFDTHQQTRLRADGYPVAGHVNCNTLRADCVVGWMMEGKPPPVEFPLQTQCIPRAIGETACTIRAPHHSRGCAMSTHHAKLIGLIFHDPPGHNIHWRDVESLLRHVGAEIEPRSGARVRVMKTHVEAILHRPHHHTNELDKQGLVHLREFLARVGVTPSSYEAS